jgi:hypothetical protein
MVWYSNILLNTRTVNADPQNVRNSIIQCYWMQAFRTRLEHDPWGKKPAEEPNAGTARNPMSCLGSKVEGERLTAGSIFR